MADWIGALIASSVLNGIGQGLILTGLVWLVLRALPRTPAATRYAVWVLTLAVVVLLPFAGWLHPAAVEPLHAVAVVPAATNVAPLELPAQGGWAVWALAAWGLVALALVGRVAWSYLVLRGIKARGVPPGAAHRALFEQVRRGCPGRRPAVLLASDEIPVPLAAGLTQPTVLVPAFLVDHLSETELRDVLAHELAHLRRWDDWTNLAQRLVEAVFFFHPAVVWMGNRLRLERELACDDWVVALAGTARPYAACLTKLAALAPLGRPQLAPGAVARKPQISIRVEALLAATRNGTARFSRMGLAAASAALAAAGAVVLGFAPVGVTEPPVPVLAAQTRTAAVPALAYTRPRPVVRPAPAAPRTQVARAARPREIPTDALAEQLVVAEWQAQAPQLTCVVVLRDGEPAWIQVFWLRTVRTRTVVLGRA
jgi:beta-lactamase regulating signal transducer with metallopeptidase domain